MTKRTLIFQAFACLLASGFVAYTAAIVWGRIAAWALAQLH